jgi:hypothetical protein
VHATARQSYVKFLEGMDFITPANREMKRMGENGLDRHLVANQRAFQRFKKEAHRVTPFDLVSRSRGDRSVGDVA